MIIKRLFKKAKMINRFHNFYGSIKNNTKYSFITLSFICLILYLPFINKAFHIDSIVYIYTAKQMLINPVNPSQNELGRILSLWNHTDLPLESAFYSNPHPPLIPVYLMPFIKYFGENEIVLHFAMFPFYLMAVWYAYLLSRIFLPKRAFELALLFALSPAILVNAQNIMVDIPLSAFIMAFFYHLFRSENIKHAFISGMFGGFACLTKSTAGTIIFSAIAYAVITKRYKSFIVFIIPFVGLNSLWIIHNFILWGKTLVFSTGHAHYILGDIRYRGERMISYIGGALIFPMPILLLALNKKRDFLVFSAFLAVTLIWGILLWSILGYGIYSALFCAICAGCGLHLLYLLFCYLPEYSINAGYKLPVVLHVIFQLVGGLFLTLFAVRYLAPIVFFLILGFAFGVEQIKKEKLQNILWIFTLCLSTILSVSLSYADYCFVGAEKKIAENISKSYNNKNVYFKGRLGYLYYMYNKGFNYLFYGSQNIPEKSIVVNALAPNNVSVFSVVNPSRLKKISEISYCYFPLRTIGSRGGFYGNDRLPYSLDFNNPSQKFDVYEVTSLK